MEPLGVLINGDLTNKLATLFPVVVSFSLLNNDYTRVCKSTEDLREDPAILLCKVAVIKLTHYKVITPHANG